MEVKRFHRRLLVFSLFVCLFILADSYLIPLKFSFEVITEFRVYRYRTKPGRSSHNYTILTGNKVYDVPEDVYERLHQNDTVVIEKSVLTGSVQKLMVKRYDYYYEYEIGFARARAGFIFVPLIIMGIIAFLIFYESLKNHQGRKNLTYFLFISSIVVLLFHLNLHIF